MDTQSFTVDTFNHNIRLDRFLIKSLPDESRNFIQKLIKDEQVTVNKKTVTKPSLTLKETNIVSVTIPPPKEVHIEPVDIPLNIIYEDANILVINKEPGIVVHPSDTGSHSNDSIVNAVMYHCKNDLSGISGELRPGIVHRLDKDTSGLLMIAKNDTTHKSLSDIIKNREIKKVYTVLVRGHLSHKKGTIDAPIGRSIKDRKKMSVMNTKTHKNAITHFEVLEEFEGMSLIQAHIVTGRTHQIRVHFQSIGHPVAGDIIYGEKGFNTLLKKDFGLTRQFLHATTLDFNLNNKKMSFSAPLTHDLQEVLQQLKHY